MRRKLGTVFMLFGAVLILAALSLFLWNWRDDVNAANQASEVMPQLVQAIEAAQAEPDATSGEGAVLLPAEPDLTMTTVEIDGHLYIGYITFPTLGMELPILADWSAANLKIAPCRYYGTVKANNMVLCAHNRTTHFGPIMNFSIGDPVYFTDMDGVVYAFEVSEVTILQPTAIEEMVTSGYDLTLFTCTYGGKTRVTVRCTRVD